MATTATTSMDDFAAKMAKFKEPEVEELYLDIGFPPLNKILGGDYSKGFPYGRVAEIYGPAASGKTVLATQAMIQAQRQGGMAVFVDWECAFSDRFAEEMGLNSSFPYFHKITPETFEDGIDQAFEFVSQIREQKPIKAEAPIVMVFDSIAAAVPKSVMYDSKGVLRVSSSRNMNDNLALAKATSSHLPRVAQLARKFNAVVIFLNQLREKPGVCLRGDVMIPFVDGTAMSIKDIVEKKIAKEVWSWSEEFNKFEPKMISQWHDNGEASSYEDWTHIRATGAGTRNGVKAITATNDHLVMTQRAGWTKASEVVVGDKLLTTVEKKINGTLREFFGGLMFGDSSVNSMGAARNTAQLSIQDNVDSEYSKWKVETLTPFMSFKEYAIKWNGGEGVVHKSDYSHELMEWMPLNRSPLKLIEAGFLTHQALALWIMDDGYLAEERRYTLSIKRIKDGETLEAVADALFEMGFRSRVREHEGSLTFDTDSTKLISKAIAKYVPECMQRKLMLEDRGQYTAPQLATSLTRHEHWETVTKVCKPGVTFKVKSKRARFDIGVDDNHSYLAGSVDGGFLVHNCYGDPTYTPGGKTPEFVATTRLQVSSKKIMEEAPGGKEFKGRLMEFKTTKSKSTRPFQTIDMRLVYDDEGKASFDFTLGLIEHLTDHKKLEEKGGRVVWTDGKSYWKAVLAKKIDEENLSAELIALLHK